MQNPIAVFGFRCIKGVGNSTLLKLINRFGSLEAAWQADVSGYLSKDSLEQLVLAKNDSSSLAQVIHEQHERAIAHKAQWIVLNDINYPKMLKEIPDAPASLMVQGSVDVLSSPQIAMVGSRKSSMSGRRFASTLAADLAQHFVITSGLAVGIDTIVAEGAIASGRKSIAVLGSGLDVLYPSSNAQLAENIIGSGGAIVSEYNFGVQPLSHNFPRRNRVVSGLSCGVIVVEAGEKSGSLITARMALQQGRDVFAVPGRVDDPNKKGCHLLIKEGAVLVCDAQDIVQECAGVLSYTRQQQDSAIFTDHQQQVIGCIGYDCVDIDDIVELTGLSINEVASIVTELEMQGAIIRTLTGFERV